MGRAGVLGRAAACRLAGLQSGAAAAPAPGTVSADAVPRAPRPLVNTPMLDASIHSLRHRMQGKL